jgi:hypothetical protein
VGRLWEGKPWASLLTRYLVYQTRRLDNQLTRDVDDTACLWAVDASMDIFRPECYLMLSCFLLHVGGEVSAIWHQDTPTYPKVYLCIQGSSKPVHLYAVVVLAQLLFSTHSTHRFGFVRVRYGHEGHHCPLVERMHSTRPKVPQRWPTCLPGYLKIACDWWLISRVKFSGLFLRYQRTLSHL